MSEQSTGSETKPIHIRFPVGTRVVMTNRAISARLEGRSRVMTGVVVGYARSRYLIRVLKDGYKQPNVYHESFWSPVKQPTPAQQ